MGLFGKKERQLQPLMVEADYDATVNYLVGLSAQEYSKVLQVCNIYRESHQKAAEVLGRANEPTSFIEPQTIDPEFLELPTPKRKRVQVK